MNTLYLVGDKKAHTTNSWLAMAKSKEEAERLLGVLPKASQIKEKHYDHKWRPLNESK